MALPVQTAYKDFTLALPQIKSISRFTDQISNLGAQAQREVANIKLYLQYALAGVVGFIPFTVSKIGEGVMKGSAFLVKNVGDISISYLGIAGFVSEIFFRAIAGIPTTIAGGLFSIGAVAFSKSQALVWGQHLIEHPQEERVNTKLARYGASDKPWNDFKLLVDTYFLPFSSIEIEHEEPVQRVPEFNIDRNLKHLQNLEVT